ncbi:hypothetical protein K435DRAFT_526861 [Dendrothele bispora CBS 962.96]|uniref:Uncharacterized protein n=1 Tax=Dendrothele bispora (strain CBS 962.96) TaxID=1314807 RepID=A0A4S8M9P0_DENBC|nr:hypothetical protein K435DRAFT_526861 [Dendrothele bispora CBS 962.96]
MHMIYASSLSFVFLVIVTAIGICCCLLMLSVYRIFVILVRTSQYCIPAFQNRNLFSCNFYQRTYTRSFLVWKSL